MDRLKETSSLRINILKKIEDLKQKIEEDESFPEFPQDTNSLMDIEERLDEILNAWYY